MYVNNLAKNRKLHDHLTTTEKELKDSKDSLFQEEVKVKEVTQCQKTVKKIVLLFIFYVVLRISELEVSTSMMNPNFRESGHSQFHTVKMSEDVSNVSRPVQTQSSYNSIVAYNN